MNDPTQIKSYQLSGIIPHMRGQADFIWRSGMLQTSNSRSLTAKPLAQSG